MTIRFRNIVVGLGFIVFGLHLLADLQLIIKDRAQFLDEVEVTVKKTSPAASVRVWRVTIDNQTTALTDIVVDTSRQTTTYRNVPRVAFIRELQLGLETPDAVDSVTVTIGTQQYHYSRPEVLVTWPRLRPKNGATIFAFPYPSARPGSVLPTINQVINWRGDGILLTHILLNNVNILIFIGLFLLAYWQRQRVMALLATRPSVFIQVIGCLLFALLKCTFHVRELSGDLDPSWMLGLNWAKMNGFQWGTDFVFTYGPYAWVIYPTIIASHSILVGSFVVNWLVTALAFGVVFCELQRLYANRQIGFPVLVLAGLLLTVFGFEFVDYTSVAALVLLYTAVSEPTKRHAFWRFNGALALLALLSLIKFSYVAVSGVLLVMLTVVYLSRRNWLRIINAWGIYGLSVVVLWLSGGQSLMNLPAFLATGVEIAGGYSEAMANPLWADSSALLINLVSVAFLSVALLVMLALVAVAWLTRRQAGVWLFSWLAAPVVFLSFKEGFVRFDPDHMAFFYSQLLMLLVAYFIVLQRNNLRIDALPAKVLIGLGLVACCITRSAQVYTLMYGRLLADEPYRQQIATTQTARLLRDYQAEPAHIALIRQSTGADIIPFNIALLYATGATWNPRPVIQSYSAYTSALSTLNGQHYQSSQAPACVWLSFQSIDNRYPPADDPALYRALSSQYVPVLNQANSYLILNHRPGVAARPLAVELARSYTLNNWISVPATVMQSTFISADVDLTLWGKLLNILYKIPPLTMQIETTDRGLTTYRVIRRNLTDAVLISDHLTDVATLENWLTGHGRPTVRRVRFLGNSLFYKTVIPVRMQH